MKFSKFILAAVLVCATIGVYASAKSHVNSIAFYVSDLGTCELFDVDYPCDPGAGGCEDILVPATNQQLYQSNVGAAGLPCSIPLERE